MAGKVEKSSNVSFSPYFTRLLAEFTPASKEQGVRLEYKRKSLGKTVQLHFFSPDVPVKDCFKIFKEWPDIISEQLEAVFENAC